MTAVKSYQSESITPEQLRKISKFTRREIQPQELFVFSVRLCDNQIDRDGERFSSKALEKLAELYRGKTGVFDHEPRSENQAARIFDTRVVKDKENPAYQALQAWAYIVRCEKNADLILEIDAGIKKEVSVGCAVANIRCSICGSNQRAEPCDHQKGKSYNGALCHYILEEPTDAYEWSFVAVPAQPNAGVIKRYGAAERPSAETLLDSLKNLESREKAVDTPYFRQQLEELKDLALLGQRYQKELQRNIIHKAAVAQPHIDSGILEQVVQTLTPSQLTHFSQSADKMAADKLPITTQLAPPTDQHQQQQPFQI